MTHRTDVAHPWPHAPWAKLRRDAVDPDLITGWHSLVAHSADVSAVVETLLRLPTVMRRMSVAAGVPHGDTLDDPTVARLCLLAALHDVGKSNVGFQARSSASAPKVGHVDEVAWVLDTATQATADRFCAAVGMAAMAGWGLSRDLLDAVLAHHGRPARGDKQFVKASIWAATPNQDPMTAVASVTVAARTWFPDAIRPTNGPLPDTPAFQHAFAGLLMLADWLGSDTTFFPMLDGGGDIEDSRVKARRAVEAVGLDVEAHRPRTEAGFEELFGKGLMPTWFQKACVRAEGRVVVAESETGSGKTEAALSRFASLFAKGEVDSLYFALPTRVAATSMHARVLDFARRAWGEIHPPVVLAIPGQLRSDDAQGKLLPSFEVQWSDGADDPRRWSAERPKRFLAAPIAVGTIDQALAATLSIKHAHLRGASLMRSLLVVDEVHASDPYMSALLKRLLDAHAACGGHALLLSATLGASARSRYLDAPLPSPREASSVPYPLVSGLEAVSEGVGHARRRDVQISCLPCMGDHRAVAERAFDAARRGARVLVIRNSVRETIATVRDLVAMAGHETAVPFSVRGVATVHHSRFSKHDRRLLDARVEELLGKGRPRDGGCVVVGTQTLEMSLDIDADLLITDLCPIDVLLQRLGRLHRHSANVRPTGFNEPHAIVLVPMERDLIGSPPTDHGIGIDARGFARAYPDLRAVEATWRMLERHGTLSIPHMNRMLVEGCLHPEVLASIADEARAAGKDMWLVDRLGSIEAVQRIMADGNALDRTKPFSTFRIVDEAIIGTRLGLADLHVEFPEPPMGPFGKVVRGLDLPHFMVGRPSHDEVPVVTSHEGGFEFALGGRCYRYGQYGLENISRR